MLLQIHDELVFEARPNELDRLTDLVRDEMQTVMPLRVPLKVDVKTGDNWAALRISGRPVPLTFGNHADGDSIFAKPSDWTPSNHALPWAASGVAEFSRYRTS